jgi:hypothetical protein
VARSWTPPTILIEPFAASSAEDGAFFCELLHLQLHIALDDLGNEFRIFRGAGFLVFCGCGFDRRLDARDVYAGIRITKRPVQGVIAELEAVGFLK